MAMERRSHSGRCWRCWICCNCCTHQQQFRIERHCANSQYPQAPLLRNDPQSRPLLHPRPPNPPYRPPNPPYRPPNPAPPDPNPQAPALGAPYRPPTWNPFNPPLLNPHFINRPYRPQQEFCPIHGVPACASNLVPRKEDESTVFQPAPNRPPHSGNKIPSCINRQALLRAPQDRSCNNRQAPAPQSLNNPTQVRPQSPNLANSSAAQNPEDPPNEDEGAKSDSPRNADESTNLQSESTNLQSDNGQTAPNHAVAKDPQTSASSFHHPSSSHNQAPDLSSADEPTDCELNPQEDCESSQQMHMHSNISTESNGSVGRWCSGA